MNGVTSSPSLSRRASTRGRPQNAPMGPRTRNISRNSLAPSDILSAPSQGSRESTLYSPGASPRYTYTAPSESSAEHSGSDSKALAAIAEREYDSPPAPPDPPAPPPPPQQAPETPDEPLNIKAVPKVAALTPPLKMDFESVPVKWKGLPLEAALWTFNSRELQELVSRAIRSSSRESFIRVLSVENLDQNLPAELERLNALKAVAQSKHRFTVHRRTMLLQALHSFSGYTDREKDGELIAKLTSQLSQATAECDKLLEDLLQIADQVGQITRLLDVHWASALAIALRKLNSSYGRRTSELLSARAKISTLEAELNDAWQQAERLAREMDELDAEAASDEDDAVIEVAEVISLNHRKSPSASSELGMRSVLSIDAISRMYSEQSQMSVVPSQVADPAATEQMQAPEESQAAEEVHTELPPASPSQIMLPSPSPSETAHLDSAVPNAPTSPHETFMSPQAVEPMAEETASIHSARSARSVRSARSTRSVRSAKSAKSARTTRTTDTTRVNSVSAARRRSLRTSMGSLRMPSIKGRKAPDSHPPVPSLPAISPVASLASRAALGTATADSFLDFSRDTSESDTDDADADPPVPRRTSLDEIEVVARTQTVAITTRDDIHVMPSRSAAENELVTSRRSQFSLDHQHPFANEEPATESIPSIWLLQDAPKTPAERVESMMRDRGGGHAKIGSFQRLKSLTKRYSLPFPAARPKPPRNGTTNS